MRAIQSEQLQGVEDQVATLESDLKLLESFLIDVDAKKHTSAVVRKCVEEIKEIVFDAEDKIETYLLKEELGKTSKSIKKRIRRHACIIPYRREIASDMRGISKRISKVIRIIADVRDSQPLEMRKEFPREYKNDLVGLEENVKELVGYLVEEDDVQVVSMTGMGGLGKTTLARQAFNNETVNKKFDGLAWVCVSQVCNRKNVWQKILQNLTPREKKDEIMQMTEDTLHDELFRLLETSKSFIVFDDIWKEEHWDLIKPIFPPKKGWKVLLTSRNESVAGRGDTTYINFKPKCLTTDESWILFQKIAIPRKDTSKLKVDEEMEEMGKEMIKYCGGLPLAVRVLGGLLAEKYTLHEWERVSENLGSHLCGRPDSFYHVLSLSFEELPSNLKDCFLYLAHFPEDYQISVGDLSYYWAAEGILRPEYLKRESVRDVADDYIQELVKRNMVISERDMVTLRFETCHLHDMMREVCLLKAKEEKFLQIANTYSTNANSQFHGTSRRFIWHYPTTIDLERQINSSKLRSLLIVSDRNNWKLSGSSFARLELLRMLNLNRAEFEGHMLPYGIGKLIHLRYLSLEDCEVSELPSSLGNLRLLIYLNLHVRGESIFVPNVLMGMKELRYLALPLFMHEKTKLELSNLEKLETLKNFYTHNCSLEDLRGMARLRTLRIKIIGETCLETLSASIGGLRHLENLHLDGLKLDVKKIEKGFVLDAVNLRQLRMEGLYMPKFPDERHFPSHLTTISLFNSRLEEDPMPILGKLLQLKHVSLRPQSFRGRRLVCSAGGFPQLQTLVIYGIQWEDWIVENGSMPLLHTLTIDCDKLKEVPDGLRFLTSLKYLQCQNRKEWKERLTKGGEDYYKVQHIPTVRFIWI